MTCSWVGGYQCGGGIGWGVGEETFVYEEWSMAGSTGGELSGLIVGRVVARAWGTRRSLL